MKYIVKDSAGKVVLETAYKENAIERASKPGYKLITVVDR